MKITKFIKNPKQIIVSIADRGYINWLSDELYLKLIYWCHMGRKLNLKSPQTFNEKIQWLKLYDRNSLYTKLVDKYEVKKYVSKTIGEKYIVPTLGVWDSFEEINFDDLPNKFVLKCTHDSGGIVICKSKNDLDLYKSKVKIDKSLKNKFYLQGREWVYKDVKPRIIAEKFIEDKSQKELRDYKFFCFNGIPKIMFIASDRFTDTKFDFFEVEGFKHISVKNGHDMAGDGIEKPDNYNKMVELCYKLSKNIPFVRIDFYDSKEGIYFGEMTFYHHSGIVAFDPEEYDYIFGKMIDLSKVFSI